ncbi:MAG: hypothetical protein WDZ70_00705 [Candidatus Paceibacterota bacterium]
MLNIFPEFLIPFLAPTILRIGVGATLFLDSSADLRKYSKKKPVEIGTSALLLIASILLIIGLATQLAALYIFIDTIVRLVKSKHRRKGRSRAFYILLAVASLSLFVSGAGAIAIDIPL